MIHTLLLSLMLAVTIPEKPATNIVDQAALLSDGARLDLEKTFQDVRGSQGVTLGLLTLTNLDDEPKAVAVRAINYWNLGPDSVLVLISTNPRKMYIQPGNNLQYRFTEAVSVGIIRDHMAPAMKAGRFSAGITNGFQAISSKLPGPAVANPNTASRPEPVREESWASQHPVWVTFFILVGVLLTALLGRWIYQDNKKRVAEQKRLQEELQSFQARLRAETQERERKEAEARRKASTDPMDRLPEFNRATHKPLPSAKPIPPKVVAKKSAPSTTTNSTNVVVVQQQTYVPPPSPPRRQPDPSPPRSSWSSSDSSSYGSGGGGSDWGSSDSGGGSDGGGGGGSDW